MCVEIRLLSSLEKVFWDEVLQAAETRCMTALRGERVSFQVACCVQADHIQAAAEATCPIGTPEIYEVGQVPVTFPAYAAHDDGYLRTAPGLYPDALYPHKNCWDLVHGQWRCLWISMTIPPDAPAGKAAVTIRLRRTDLSQALLGEAVFTVEVIPATLPEQTLLHTNWFHCDCLATRYKVPVFSEEHWAIIERYMKNAAAFGVNMILTPVFTPPLDTEVGGERPTVQLVDITVKDGGYFFGFSKLERYMALAEKCGLRYFEISHLFTQWGAKAAPKITADVGGETRRIFGWETDASSPEYRDFLTAFLQELKDFLTVSGRSSRCYFHISDEPSLPMLDDYRRAKESVAAVLDGFPLIDALSSYAFYEKGVVSRPIPSNDHIDSFLENGVEHLWTYYCCAQGNKVSNRFIAMPSQRNRILGCQLFKYRIEGFLQWGYNFWYSQLSREEIDPFLDTGARCSFPAGDAFLVYPGPDGQPIPSLRQMVFLEALQDMRALQLLAFLTSHEDAVALIETEGTITFTAYPRSADFLLSMREAVNRRIAQSLH